MSNYVLVQWPESQDLMEEEWFDEEAILALGCEDITGSSAYFIPAERVGQLYPESVVLDLLHSMDVGIIPETYTASKGLGPEDYMDLAQSKALELGLLEKFKEYVKPFKSEES